MIIVSNKALRFLELDFDYEELGKHLDVVNDMIREHHEFSLTGTKSNGNIYMAMSANTCKEYLYRMSRPYVDPRKKEK